MADGSPDERDARLGVPEDPADAELVSASSLRPVLLACLNEFDEPVTLPDLADEIAIRQADAEITDIPGEHVKEIYLSLYHSHIPRLADAGILEYDQETDLVASAPGIDLDRLIGPADDS